MTEDSPRKKAKRSKSKSKPKDMQSAEKPDKFLAPQGQIFPWLEQSYVDGMNEIAKRTKVELPFEWKKVGSLPVGTLIYRLFEASGKSPPSVYLAKTTFRQSTREYTMRMEQNWRRGVR